MVHDFSGRFQWKISGSNGTSEKVVLERLPFEWNSRWIFWTNGIALFITKKTERIEPYHLIRSFGCKCFPAPLRTVPPNTRFF